MAIKTKTFSLLSFIFVVACLIALIISFASDRWVVSTEKEVSGFKNIGLWSACFARYRPPAWALVDKYYDGCWWVFDREMDELRHFLFPPWFKGTQVLVTLSLTFQLIAIIIMIVNAINCFPYNKFKDKISLGLSIISAILHGVTAILLIVAVTMFGARADNERTWLEKPDQNYLSWSFGLCVLAAFLAILSAMAAAVEFYRLRLSRGGSSEPQVFLTNIPPPKPAYVYSNQKFQPTYIEKSNPAYVSRYSNQNSHSSQPAKPPDTMFAVSGAGQVYVNHSYVSDEHLQRGRTNGYVPAHDRQQAHPPAHQERKQLEGRSSSDNVDTKRFQHSSTALNAAESQNVASKESVDKIDDYEASKKIKHPVLPEYTPKTKPESEKKLDIDNTLDESCDTDIQKTEKDFHEQERKRTRSDSKKKKSTRSRSSSRKHKKKKKADVDDDKHSHVGRPKRRSKTQGSDSDDRHSHSHSRTSRSTTRKSHSRERTSSRHRSKSRDLNSSCSDNLTESDSASLASRSRQKQRNDNSSSRKNGKHRSASKESSRKEKHQLSKHGSGSTKKGHDRDYTDDVSGSEFSSKQTSKRTDSHRGTKKSARSLEYSDTESVRSKHRSKSKDNPAEKMRTKARDYSDTESTRSKHSRHDYKPKGTYSSYYEY